MEYRKLSELVKLTNNPRTIEKTDMDRLTASIAKFGVLPGRPLILSNRTGELVIICGNQRYEVCKKLKIQEVPTDLMEGLSIEDEAEIIVRDNISNGAWDQEILASDWDRQKLIEWGVDVSFETVEPVVAEDDFEVDESIKTDIVIGDLFEIGDHRLLCGDSTNIDQVSKLMNGEKADGVWVDPPYNIGFKPQRGTHDTILNDDMSEADFEDFLRSYLANQFISTKENSVAIIWMGWSTIHSFQKVIKEFYTIKSMPVWYKNNFGIGYWTRPQYEPCFLCLKGEPEKPDTVPSDVWEYAKVYKTLHSCEKPIPLIGEKVATFITGNLILDLFGGSGSTMVASHQLERKCYMMELDPKYVQTIVNRMLKLDPTIEIKKNGQLYITAQ